MKQFACATVMDGCPGVVTAATEEEVLAAAARHARDDHGLTELSDDVVTAVRAGIVDVAD